MKNSELVGQDNILIGPKHDYLYLDTKAGIDRLDELKAMFHCETVIFHIEDSTQTARIIYHANTGELRSINCNLEIFYPKDVQKVKMLINGQVREFTEADGLGI